MMSRQLSRFELVFFRTHLQLLTTSIDIMAQANLLDLLQTPDSSPLYQFTFPVAESGTSVVG